MNAESKADGPSAVKMLVKIDEDLKELTGTMTAPEDGYFVGYMFTENGGSGSIHGTIFRGGREQFSAGCSCQWGGAVKIPYGSYSYPAKTGDQFRYDIEFNGCYGGVGFSTTGEH